MDNHIGKRYKKDTLDGWKCPVCRLWFEGTAACAHYKREHPQEWAAAIQAAADRSILRRMLV